MVETLERHLILAPDNTIIYRMMALILPRGNIYFRRCRRQYTTSI